MQQVSITGIKRHHHSSALVHLYWILLIFFTHYCKSEATLFFVAALGTEIMKKSKNDGRDKMDKKLF